MKKLLGLLILCAVQASAQNPGPFYQAKSEIEKMLSGEIPLSYERAVFLTENAYWGNRVDEQSYTSVLDYHTLNILLLAETNRHTTRTYKPTLIKTIRQQQEDYNHLLLNWAIYTYMTDTTAILWQGDTIHHYPMLYSHSDPMGVLSWENTQVLGLLDNQNTRGNCYAMASLFYIFSRRLHTNAAISTAPGHIFIVHPDETGRTYNIDLPTRRFPGNGSMEVFTNTTEQALKSGLSMRRLDEKQAVALTLVYLAKAWQQRFGEWNNDFILDCADLCLGHDSLNLNALLVKAELLEAKVLSKSKSILDLQTDPDFRQYETLIARLYDLGYREMSLDAKNKVIFMLQRDTVGHFTSRDHTPDLGTGIPYATLSHGLFDEMHYDQPQEKYSRTILDTKTRKIVTFTSKDSLYNHYPMDLSLFGWSVDPMAYQRVSWTPYNAMRNNPIMNIDPTGALDGDYYSTSGQYLGSDDKHDDKVYLVHGNTSQFNVNDFKNGGKYGGGTWKYNTAHLTLSGVGIGSSGTLPTYKQTSLVEQLPVSHSVFLMVAGIAYNETYANKDIDKFRVANTILNRNSATRVFVNDANIQTTLALLSGDPNDDHESRMDPNRDKDGQSTEAYAKFYSSSIEVRNSDYSMRMSIAAAGNALSFWGTDYSLKAHSWRGANASSNFSNRFKPDLQFKGELIQYPLPPSGNLINFNY